MVVWDPLRTDEIYKRCSGCKGLGRRSPDPDRSNFYLYKHGKNKGRYSHYCIGCDNARGREGYQRDLDHSRGLQKRSYARRVARRQENPELGVRYRKLQREAAQRRRKRDPKAVNAANRRWLEKLRTEDPARWREYCEQRNAMARMAYRLRQERLWIESGGKKGKPLDSIREVRGARSDIGEMLPIDEYRSWVQSLIDYEYGQGNRAAKRTIATSLGVTGRRIWEWTQYSERIGSATVERITDRWGGVTLEDLYGSEDEREERQMVARWFAEEGYGDIVRIVWAPVEVARKRKGGVL